jgi:phage terminase Nu1 subunit (DNA packaging protein)
MILNGWKEIANYVNSSVRTVQRWERAGLPVMRPLSRLRGSVIAYSEQLDSWLGRSHSETRSTASQAGISHGENLFENLLRARSLTKQLRATKVEMRDNLSMLESEVLLLKENVTRMKLASSLYMVVQRVTSVAPESLSPTASELEIQHKRVSRITFPPASAQRATEVRSPHRTSLA